MPAESNYLMVQVITYPRLTGAVLAVALGMMLGVIIGASLQSILIAALFLPLLIFVGALAPRVLMAFSGQGVRRVDFYQWKFGITLWSAAYAILFFARFPTSVVGGLATATLLGLYIAGKWGCYRSGCCGSMPYRVVNATTSLPVTEIRISGGLLVIVCMCIVLDRSSSAVLIGLTGHVTTRALGYWGRGERINFAGLMAMPDIPALLTIIVIQALCQPHV
ncbi:hypothetical protein Q7L38_00710 [Pseudomonas protegens]|uniref:hypothetical protein n=1 Tax=Pseudomonas protegens TaxID=380021 RepID=UPI00275A02E9|nr:hypothetical protein [Pseudomonas protegens]MDP9531071.1 hypothetical protein [Pseudomonas protegens]